VRLLDLTILYLLAGLGCAVAVWRTERSLGSGLLALALWPIWAPVVLAKGPRKAPRRRARSKPSGAAQRESIEDVIADAQRAAAGTPFETMLNEDAARRIANEVERAREKLEALDDVLEQPGFQRDEQVERLDDLQARGANEATLRTARLHLDSVERLGRMRATQAAALIELEQVLVALRSQLLVARHVGSNGEGVDAIVGDLWARVEGLGEALDSDEARVHDEPKPPVVVEVGNDRAPQKRAS
jgi:hypothetical protein